MPRSPRFWLGLVGLGSLVQASEALGGPINVLLALVSVIVIACGAKAVGKAEKRSRVATESPIKPAHLNSRHVSTTRRISPVTKPAGTARTLANLVPPALAERSGAVFYSGPSAFESPSRIYILGLNPGGDPLLQAVETIDRDVAEWLAGPRNWSAYADESWQGASPGTWGMQPRMLHMFNRIGIDARKVPASNVVFVRSRDERSLAAEKADLLRLCWPVHQAVIDSLDVDTIVCLGNTAGSWVRDQVRANERFDSYKETNARGWTAEAHRNAEGLAVITVNHPGRQNWLLPDSDPSALICRVLQGTSPTKAPDMVPTVVANREPAMRSRLPAASVVSDWRSAHENRLHNGGGKAAYAAMRGAERLGLVASPNTGAVSAVRLHDANGRYLFSYIVNRSGLLFYVRNPAINASPGLARSFERAFPNAQPNRAGERTLPISDAQTTNQVLEWLESQAFW